MSPEVAPIEAQMLTQVWVPFIAALIGGALSLLGSLVSIWRTNKYDRTVREEALEQSKAELAYSAFSKLINAYNYVANLKKHIDGMFDAATADGGGNLEPWAKIKEIVGAQDLIEDAKPSEIVFLIDEKRADLLNDIPLILKRIANIQSSASKYNEVRREAMDHLIENALEHELQEGLQMQAALTGNAATKGQMLTAQLNNLIGQIMEHLHEDEEKCWDVLQDFDEAARNRFKHRYPRFEISRVEA
ncbi:hypothetical protein [Shimia thalassica]|uniref:hypothetical protein n=1 Tax=Shimia thalassica TaxID=1715693 RepID=UPI0026E45BBE|nr:hypothetical protein [Shimia thalassica]MDO6483558.1 hypothetical protein [Shimia thalassica]